MKRPLSRGARIGIIVAAVLLMLTVSWFAFRDAVLTAAAKGDWDCTVTLHGTSYGGPYSYHLNLGDGSFTITRPSGRVSGSGTWSIDSGELSVRYDRGDRIVDLGPISYDVDLFGRSVEMTQNEGSKVTQCTKR